MFATTREKLVEEITNVLAADELLKYYQYSLFYENHEDWWLEKTDCWTPIKTSFATLEDTRYESVDISLPKEEIINKLADIIMKECA